VNTPCSRGLVLGEDTDLEVRLPFRLECVGRAQDGVHERAADAVLLVVRADGQWAESENGVLADVPAGA
jgi:hypothetical protein